MTPKNKLQNLQIAGVVLKRGESAIVPTEKISAQERKWNNVLVSIKPLPNGKSQVLRLR